MGAPTLLMGDAGYLVDLDIACGSDVFALWDLIPVAPGRFQIRNVGVDMNLDIQFAAVENGTPAVLYQQTPLRNQQFIFRAQGPSRFELSPAHAAFQCLSERLPHPEIWPCGAMDPTEIWQLIPEQCP